LDSRDIESDVVDTIADVTFCEREDVLSGKPVANWDSAAQVMIIASLEDKFDIDFSPEEISTLNSAQLLAASVREKLGIAG
jgi:acyl carrier protein